MSSELEDLRTENKELRDDVRNLMGMMTNVVSLLLEIEIVMGYEDVLISDETRERFQSSAGVWHGYTQKKILDATSGIIANMAEKGD